MNLERIPAELRMLQHWVCHRATPGDQLSKTPLQVDGRRAKSTDPTTWASFDAAVAALSNGHDFRGIGFVFTDADEYVGIDLDHVRDVETGTLAPWAQTLVDAAQADGAYAEISPSGDGLHIICKGEMPAGIGNQRKMQPGKLEIYSTERYFTVTGAAIHAPQVIGQGERVLDLVAQFFADGAKKKSNPPPAPVDASDSELLDRARRGRNGAKFTALYDRGDTSLYDGDDSRADMALMAMLAFWTGRDAERMERIFSGSALAQRPKWQRADYRQRTIAAAIANCRDVYQGPARRRAKPTGTTIATDERPLEVTDSDLANARRMAERYGADLCFTTETGWLVWDGRRFAADEKGVLVQRLAKDTALGIFDEVRGAADRDEIFKHAKRSQSKVAIEAMTWLVRSESGIYDVLERFDTDPMLLNVANGTIDLRTGQLRPHSREDRITRLVDVEYEPQASCELWDEFLWRITGKNMELYQYLQRLVGYLLTALTTEQAIVFLFGVGANGKTVFCEVISALLGEYAMQAMPELVMTRRHAGIPNDIASLKGRRAVLMSETTQGSRFDEAKLKHLTGGDSLTGRFLHREFFDFRPTHKLIIRGNHKPAIAGTDEGIWRRLHLVPFTVQIPEDEQDRDLTDKLLEELPGILKWAVDGCLAWQRDGLNPPDLVRSAVREYRDESDTLGRFIEERCTVGKLEQVKSGSFFSAYRDFCEKVGERWIPSKDLPTEMQRRGFDRTRRGTGVLYLGVGWSASEAPDRWSE